MHPRSTPRSSARAWGTRGGVQASSSKQRCAVPAPPPPRVSVAARSTPCGAAVEPGRWPSSYQVRCKLLVASQAQRRAAAASAARPQTQPAACFLRGPDGCMRPRGGSTWLVRLTGAKRTAPGLARRERHWAPPHRRHQCSRGGGLDANARHLHAMEVNHGRVGPAARADTRAGTTASGGEAQTKSQKLG